MENYTHNFLDIKRPDGWAATIEPLTFGKWKLAFYDPRSSLSSFIDIQGPGSSLGFLAKLVSEILLLERPIPIQYVAKLSAEDFVELILPEHEAEEQRDDGWYRFRHDGEYWRCSKA